MHEHQNAIQHDEGAEPHAALHHHEVADASARMIPAAPMSAEAPAPFYLVSNRTLVRPVAKGDLFRLADVEIDPASELLALRQKQDARFFPG